LDTLLDEQSILGLGLGAGLSGLLPVPEIQYLAYLHNAEDQLRGEAASMQFFSAGQYRNPMVVRVAGLAYQKGFGGHFHNDNAVGVLRDIPGLVVAVPSRAEDAPPWWTAPCRFSSSRSRSTTPVTCTSQATAGGFPRTPARSTGHRSTCLSGAAAPIPVRPATTSPW
jgi:2-oxoisovalerate dehydrogenase E1 component